MFDITGVKSNSFDVKLFDKELNVNLPTLRNMKKIFELTAENGIDNIATALSIALSQNEQCEEITIDYIENHLSHKQIDNTLTAYLEFIANEKNAKN